MYYNTRWYDPALGRFVQADSLIPQPGNPMAWDRYGYVMNNPVRYTDPSGHWACEDNDETGRCFNSIHGNREGQHFSDGGLNMLRLYHEFDKTPGYWSSDGNFTLEEFIGFYVLAETNSSEPNIILIEAITRRIWTGGGGYIPYCSEKNCVVGIFNFFGEYSDSSILAYRYLVESSVGFSDDYYPAGREGIFELYAFDIGRRILNPPSSWKQYDPDKPYHFGNNEGLVEAWEDVGNEDGYLYNQLVVSYGNFYIATINQDNYWHCRIGALSGSICGIYPNP